MKKKECVYFIRQRGLTPVKIGYTSEPTPENRLKSFETGSPYGIDLIGFVSIENGLQLESKLHGFFKSKKINNEWFDLTDDEVDLILFCYGQKPQRNVSVSVIFNEFFKNTLAFDIKMYNSDLSACFVGDISGKKIINELNNYCIVNNIEITKGKDSRRWFILKQL